MLKTSASIVIHVDILISVLFRFKVLAFPATYTLLLFPLNSKQNGLVNAEEDPVSLLFNSSGVTFMVVAPS